MSSNTEIIKRLHLLLSVKTKNAAIYSDIGARITEPQIKEKMSGLVFIEKDHCELIEQAIALLEGKT